MYVQRNIEARLCNHCCSGKAISITYSECVSGALGTQREKCMRHTEVACPAVQYFPILSHKRHDFISNIVECKMCVLIFSATFA